MENEKKIGKVEVSKARSFFVWCDDCKKSIYDAEKEDYVTLVVAEMAMRDHSMSFDPPHNLFIVKTDGNFEENNYM